MKWFTNNKELKNINLLRMLPIVNGPLLSAFFFRCGIRCTNPELYYSAYQRASLITFINNNQNYQVISSFELYLIKCAPPEIKDFMYRILFQRIKKHQSWDSCSEDLDYRLEEKNRYFKQNLHTSDPTMDDWRISMSNTQRIENMRTNASPDYEQKILYCRTQLRNSEYLDYDSNSSLKNLDGISLSKDSLNFENFARDMKKEYLVNVTKSKSFVKAAIPKNNLKIVKE